MILVWGHKGYCDLLGYVIERCPQCSTTGPFSVKQVRKKFTVYFIPTFSYGCKQYAECFACHSTFEIAKEQKERIAGALMNQDQLAALIRDVQESVAHDRAARQAVLAQPVRAAGRLIASSDPVQQARIDREAEQNATKQCPYCAESIKKEAVFCRFCRHDLAAQYVPEPERGSEPAPEPKCIEDSKLKNETCCVCGGLTAAREGVCPLCVHKARTETPPPSTGASSTSR